MRADLFPVSSLIPSHPSPAPSPYTYACIRYHWTFIYRTTRMVVSVQLIHESFPIHAIDAYIQVKYYAIKKCNGQLCHLLFVVDELCYTF